MKTRSIIEITNLKDCQKIKPQKYPYLISKSLCLKSKIK